MNKIIIASILCLLSLNLLAQENYIEVIGKADKKVSPDMLTYTLILTEGAYINYDYVNAYERYDYEEDVDLQEEVIEEYKDEEVEVEIPKTPEEVIKELSKALDISKDAFKVNKNSNSPISRDLYGKGSILLIIEGKKQKEIEEKLDKVKSPRISNWRIVKSEILPKTKLKAEQELLKKAIENARSKAEFIVKSEGKKLGGIIFIQEVDELGDMVSAIYGQEFKNIFSMMMGNATENGAVDVRSSAKVKFRINE